MAVLILNQVAQKQLKRVNVDLLDGLVERRFTLKVEEEDESFVNAFAVITNVCLVEELLEA